MLQRAVMALVWFCAGDLLEELCGSAHGIDPLLLRTGVKRAGKNLCGFFFFFFLLFMTCNLRGSAEGALLRAQCFTL